MTEKTNQPGGASFHFGHLHFGGIERDIHEGRYVSAADLAQAIRTRGDTPVPEPVMEYACALLAGEIARPKGRPQHSRIEVRKLQMVLSAEYARLMEALQQGGLSADDSETYGSEYNPHDEDRSPAERAARLVAALFLGGPESWRAVQNTASAAKHSQE